MRVGIGNKKIRVSAILLKATQVDLIVSRIETRSISPEQGTMTGLHIHMHQIIQYMYRITLYLK